MYPTQEEMKIPLLRLINKRKRGYIIFSEDGEDIANELSDFFELTEAQRNETRENLNVKGKSVWRNNIQWTRKKLVADGLLSGDRRDIWEITEKGKDLLVKRSM